MCTYQAPIAFATAMRKSGTSMSHKWFTFFINKRKNMLNETVARLSPVHQFNQLKTFVQCNQEMKDFLGKYLEEGIGALPDFNAQIPEVGYILTDIPTAFSQSKLLLAEVGAICSHRDIFVSSHIDEYYNEFFVDGSE
ncbi:hypothetical protein GEMRC1_000663 [Eukaryota sp. GEM-RC1]